MNYTDSNKLIAEFMGWKFEQQDNKDWFKVSHVEGQVWYDGSKFIDEWLIRGLKYHEDWNQLIPVVRGIKDYLNGLPRPSNNHCCKGDLLEVDIQCHLWSLVIEKTYDAVVKFIKWYNENKQP